jgi:hypothetical protein
VPLSGLHWVQRSWRYSTASGIPFREEDDVFGRLKQIGPSIHLLRIPSNDRTVHNAERFPRMSE